MNHTMPGVFLLSGIHGPEDRQLHALFILQNPDKTLDEASPLTLISIGRETQAYLQLLANISKQVLPITLIP